LLLQFKIHVTEVLSQKGGTFCTNEAECKDRRQKFIDAEGACKATRKAQADAQHDHETAARRASIAQKKAQKAQEVPSGQAQQEASAQHEASAKVECATEALATSRKASASAHARVASTETALQAASLKAEEAANALQAAKAALETALESARASASKQVADIAGASTVRHPSPLSQVASAEEVRAAGAAAKPCSSKKAPILHMWRCLLHKVVQTMQADKVVEVETLDDHEGSFDDDVGSFDDEPAADGEAISELEAQEEGEEAEREEAEREENEDEDRTLLRKQPATKPTAKPAAKPHSKPPATGADAATPGATARPASGPGSRGGPGAYKKRSLASSESLDGNEDDSTIPRQTLYGRRKAAEHAKQQQEASGSTPMPEVNQQGRTVEEHSIPLSEALQRRADDAEARATKAEAHSAASQRLQGEAEKRASTAEGLAAAASDAKVQALTGQAKAEAKAEVLTTQIASLQAELSAANASARQSWQQGFTEGVAHESKRIRTQFTNS
jgi:trimeric autotransporter adhesin